MPLFKFSKTSRPTLQFDIKQPDSPLVWSKIILSLMETKEPALTSCSFSWLWMALIWSIHRMNWCHWYWMSAKARQLRPKYFTGSLITKNIQSKSFIIRISWNQYKKVRPSGADPLSVWLPTPKRKQSIRKVQKVHWVHLSLFPLRGGVIYCVQDLPAAQLFWQGTLPF